MHRWLLILALSCSNAIAADFRVATFGQSCSDIEKLEKSVGSVPVKTTSNGDAPRLAFEVIALERRATVSYFCSDGRVFAENYLFPVEGYSAVLETYKRSLSLLVKMYGAPNVESSTLFPTPTLPVASWQTDRVAVLLTVVTAEAGSENPYQLSLIVAERHHKSDAGSNNRWRGP